MMSAGSPDTAASSLRRSSLAAIGSFMIRSVSFRQEVDSRLGTEKLLLNRFVQDCPDSLECQVLMPEQRRLVADAIHFMQHPKTKRSVYNFFELFQGKGPDALTAFNESMYAVCVRAIPEMHANMAKSARHAAKAYHTCSHFCDIVQSQSCMPLDRRLKGLVMALSFCHDIIQDKKEHNETESLKRFKFYLQEEFKYGKGLAGFDCATVMDAVDAIGTQVLVYGTKLVGMHETISSLANRALSTVAARFPETLTFHDREKEVQLATACMEAVDLHSSAVMYRTVDPNRDLSLADLFKDFSPKVRSIIRKYRLFFIGYAKQSAQMKIELSTGAVGEQLHDMRDRFEKKLFDYMHAEYQGAEEKDAARRHLPGNEASRPL